MQKRTSDLKKYKNGIIISTHTTCQLNDIDAIYLKYKVKKKQNIFKQVNNYNTGKKLKKGHSYSSSLTLFRLQTKLSVRLYSWVWIIPLQAKTTKPTEAVFFLGGGWGSERFKGKFMNQSWRRWSNHQQY